MRSPKTTIERFQRSSTTSHHSRISQGGGSDTKTSQMSWRKKEQGEAGRLPGREGEGVMAGTGAGTGVPEEKGEIQQPVGS